MTRALNNLRWQFLCLMLFAWSGMAQAEQPFEIGPRPGWTLMGGPVGGLCVSGFSCDEGLSGFLGAELALSRVMEGVWYGLFVDSVWDFGTDAVWFHSGPEFGFGPLGVDGGITVAFVEDVQYGLNVRGLITAGFLGFFVRYTHMPGLETDHGIHVGMMVKLPLWASAGEFE